MRGIVFDLDGTLVDSYAAIAESLNHARAGFGMPALPDERIRLQVGRGLEALIADLVGRDRIVEGVRLFRERYAVVYASKTFLLPGVVSTLKQLSERGYPMSVASNKPARFGRAIVDALGLSSYLVNVHGPDSVGSTKPDPAMLRRCVEDMQVTVSSAIYVGDMVLDVETAACADIPVILVDGGSSTGSDLRETGQICVAGLPDLLDRLPLDLRKD